MAQVSLPPGGPYQRRVSFNNLHPDDLASGTSKFYSYNMDVSTTTAQPHAADLEVHKMFGNYSLAPVVPTSSASRKRVKLPDPPEKLILKNKLTPSQLSANLQHAMLLGVSYHGDLNELAQNPLSDVPRLESAGIEVSPTDSDDEEDILPPPQVPTARRKLYSQMTDEELMALDPQFAKPRTSSIDNFKFDSTTTYYSPARRALASQLAPVQSVAKQIEYPTLNENNYKSISLTIRHNDYDTDTGTSRTLLTVISGRKHTWNSLDWLLLTADEVKSSPAFLQDGDYLVVAALVPLKFMDGSSDLRKQHSLDEKLYKRCQNLLDYIIDKLPDPLLRLKITVEFILDVPPSDPLALNYKKNMPTGNKFMLLHLFKQYHPNLVIVGNKSTNLNFKYPIRQRRLKSAVNTQPISSIGLGKIPLGSSQTTDLVPDAFLIKLSSFLVKYSTVPMILVGNSTVFHHKTETKQSTSVTFCDTRSPQTKGILDVPPLQRKNSACSDASIESFNPNDESSSTLETADELRDSLDAISHSSSEDRFADLLASVSLYSLSHLKNYLSILNDQSIDRLSTQVLNSKVHQVYSSIGPSKTGGLTTSNSNGTSGKVYKVKSLISYSEEDEKKNEKILHEKKLKKTVSRGSMVSLKSTDEKPKKKGFLAKLGLKK